jgi:hypothetical protein
MMHGTGVPGAYTGSKKLHRVLAPNTLASTFQTYEHFFLPYLVQVVEELLRVSCGSTGLLSFGVLECDASTNNHNTVYTVATCC